jgi:hypothetical protein
MRPRRSAIRCSGQRDGVKSDPGALARATLLRPAIHFWAPAGLSSTPSASASGLKIWRRYSMVITRSSSNRGPSATPKMQRMITRIVMSCIGSSSDSVRPGSRVARVLSAIASIAGPNARTLSALNPGFIGLRRARCGSPSCRMRACGPTNSSTPPANRSNPSYEPLST